MVTADKLIQEWNRTGLIAVEERPLIVAAILGCKKVLPLYLRILVGIGAVFAVSFFMTFLYAAHIMDFNTTEKQIVFGLIFVGLAIVAGKRAKNKNSAVDHSFLIQASVCAMWLGKLLFVKGFMDVLGHSIHHQESMTISLLLITVATYFLYDVCIDRYLSTLAILISFFATIVTQSYSNHTLQVILNVFFLLQLALVTVLFMQKNIKRDYIPLAYALTSSLFIMVLCFSINYDIDLRNLKHFHLIFINIMSLIALLGLLVWIAGRWSALKAESLRLAAWGIILLSVISAPGILLALFFMVLGYAKHERTLSLLGMALLPAFLFLYYYNLDINLLTKSITLISSGVLLLAARGYLVLKKLDGEV